MDQVWKGLSNLDPRDPGGFYKKPPNSAVEGTVYAVNFTVIYLHYQLLKILRKEDSESESHSLCYTE